MLNDKVLVNQNKIAMYIPPIVPKGSLVKMNLDGTEREYRVLSVNGNVCKVMGMWNGLTSKYNETSTTTTMGTLTVQKYEGSTLDTYLNTTWYNTLNGTVKSAIVPESVVCDAWYRNNTGDPDYTGTIGKYVPGTGKYTISKYTGGTLNIGNRNVFALGVQDVIDYLSDDNVKVDTSAILRNVNIWKMFWNDGPEYTGENVLLRSSFAGDYFSVWCADGDNGGLFLMGSPTSATVRPALNLDMSKIPYELIS